MELLRTPITFAAADGSTVHAPMIRARVGGLDTLLVLDTGSDVHLLTKELSDQIGRSLAEGEEGIDHSGATMPSWTAGKVPMLAGGVDLPLRDVVVIPAPTPFPGWGIGGILSPQRLHPDAYVVLDQVDDELLLIHEDVEAVAAWLARRHPGLATLRLRRDGISTTPVVRGAIVPFDETAVLVNSGGKHTEFDVTVVPGLAPAVLGRLGGGVSGSDVMGSVVGAQTLAIGGRRIPVAELALREGMVYPHAMIGRDLLRGTVVACDADPGGVLFWQVPPG
jgi:hypothetical protein